jgi:hypothetical protein
LLLTVGGASGPEHFAVGNLKPGDASVTPGWTIVTSGSVNGDLSVAANNLVNNDVTLNTVESAMGDSLVTGELGANLKVAFWIDLDASGTWTLNDYYLKPAGGSGAACIQVWQTGETTVPTAAFDTLNNMATKSWSKFKTNLAAGTYGTFKVSYSIDGPTVGNVIQTDSAGCDIMFTLDQYV